MLGPLLASLRVPRAGQGRPRTRPDALLGDKAYSARAHRAHLRERGITTVIPEPADQLANRVRRGSAGGRPVNFDKVLYKRRNVVERAFNKLKNWRGIATRYDKHAVNYRGGVVLGAIVLWLRHLRDTPLVRALPGPPVQAHAGDRTRRPRAMRIPRRAGPERAPGAPRRP